MIAYLDTSALVKLYVAEAGSDEVRAAVRSADASMTCVVAYAEARSALARGRREKILTPAQHRHAVELLDGDWGTFSLVRVSDSLSRRAGALADKHALRGFDAIHLAAALEVLVGAESHGFWCFDHRLARAAKAEGLTAHGAR